MAGIFVEIGACDFDNYEILLLDGWTGYFVEPVPDYLESLYKKIKNLSIERNKQLKALFTQCAISNYCGRGEIRYIPPSECSDWWNKGIGHINGLKNNCIENKQEFIDKSKVIETDFMTLDKYIDTMSINEIDIMKIDVEGHEVEILKNYSWKVKPRHIKIEHYWCGLNPLLDLLKTNNYSFYHDSEDIYGTFKG